MAVFHTTQSQTNQAGVAGLAREMLKSLDVPDLRCLVESLTVSQLHQLYRTVDPNYDNYEAKSREHYDALAKVLLTDSDLDNLRNYSDTLNDLQGIAEFAWFHLGFAAALRSLETPPPLESG